MMIAVSMTALCLLAAISLTLGAAIGAWVIAAEDNASNREAGSAALVLLFLLVMVIFVTRFLVLWPNSWARIV